ncbi:aldehyde dehydrogenase family protein [Jannaschia sp. LMIT008]|uniref:aldehyde dehydrogenase family protein n=1 Tax=Jannaschia maritima TaxID=3032585 RepID=UPI0028115910|nr:aldehyde dehydrogenase family protein [Jannaschia sp. LMIT008]
MDQQTTRLSLPSEPRTFGFHVDGRDVPAGEREVFVRHSPAHDVPVTRTVACTPADVDDAVAAARAAFDDRRWAGLGGADRAAVLLRAAALLRERVDEIAYWETLENGKPIAQARGEVSGCVGMFELAAGLARTLHGDTFNNVGDDALSLVMREPVGVVGVVTPWNFPFLILCERVPYILASGNAVVAKPSEFTSATTLILADILRAAGLPAGVFNVVTGTGPTVGQAMLEHRDVDMVSFTGSTRTGRAVVEASARSNFKKLGLELGGKNPQIVFADADLDDAADGVAFGIAFNSGQCCVSGSRLIVERAVADAFARKVADKLARIRTGDPLDEATQAGAITTEAQNRAILDYIEKGKAEGATLAMGGTAMDLGRGRFIAPTVFTDVTPDMTIARDEIFGPVLTILPFDTLDEAVEMANDTEYGLAASVWSKDIDTAMAVSRRVRAGRFWVNTTLAGGPELPIGGFKASGWGREAGMMGVEEYTQVKSVHIAFGPRQHWID